MSSNDRPARRALSGSQLVRVVLLVVVLCPSPAAAQLAMLDDVLRAARRSLPSVADQLGPSPAVMADDIQQLMMSGRRLEAATRMEELAALMRQRGPTGAIHAKSLSATANELRGISTPELMARLRELATFAPTRSAASVLDALPPPQRAMYQTIDSLMQGGISLPRVTTVAARQFGREFRAGAEDPHGTLKQFMDDLAPNLWLYREAQESWELIREFLASNKKAFVIGPNSDTVTVQEMRGDLRRNGHAAFFYALCKVSPNRYCPTRVVGAMFALSDVALVSDAALDSASAYIPVEIAAAYRVRLGRGGWYMFTPAEVTGGAATIAVTGFNVLPRQEGR